MLNILVKHPLIAKRIYNNVVTGFKFDDFYRWSRISRVSLVWKMLLKNEVLTSSRFIYVAIVDTKRYFLDTQNIMAFLINDF